MSKSQILFYLCLLYITGIFIYSLIEAPQTFLFESTGEETIFKGIIFAEPEKRINQQKFQVKAGGIEGKIIITTELYPEYNYGDELEISGKLQEPASFDDFDYKEYLRKDGIYSVSYYPRINLLAQNRGNRVYGQIFNLKDKLRESIDRALLPPQSALLKAIFLGDKYGLSDELKEELNITGARHIAAISGMHMIIVSQMLLFFGLAIGLWRQQVFYFVVILLILYITMIGAPASAVRAGIMAGLLLLAQKVGRLRAVGRAIVFAAAAMLLVNPLLLKSDAGFQLSFLATLSIVYLKPILDNWFQKWPNSYSLKDILTMTLAAQLGTLPLLIFHFGQLSLISPLANILIVPFLPAIMLAGMALSFSGLIWPVLVKITVWPAWLLLSYIIKTIEYLSSISWASYEIKNFSWLIFVGYYLFLTLLVKKCLKTKNLII